MSTHSNKISAYFSWVTLGVVGVCSLITAIRVVQEHVMPTYSGFGPWRPLVELPIAVLVSSIVAQIAQFIGKLANWPELKLRSQMLALGGICGLSTISTLIRHLIWPSIVNIPYYEWLVILCILIIAIMVRYRLS
ncbi:hypothetical protein ACFL3U_07020, partial [Pseudomonadota bacterium]